MRTFSASAHGPAVIILAPAVCLTARPRVNTELVRPAAVTEVV
jgi:hypothetical protein